MIDTVCIRGDLANLSTKSQSNYFGFPLAFAPHSRLDQRSKMKSPTIPPISAQRVGIPHTRLRFNAVDAVV
jgi:hypothetical protein